MSEDETHVHLVDEVQILNKPLNPSHLTSSSIGSAIKNESEIRLDAIPEQDEEQRTDLEKDTAGTEGAGEAENKHLWRKSKMRWVMLTACSTVMIGIFSSGDIYTFLQPQIEFDMFGYNGKEDTQDKAKQAKLKYMTMQSVYQVVNLIVPLIGGYLVDKVGLRISLMIFLCFQLVGQFVNAFANVFAGGEKNDWSNPATYYWVLAGRFIFAIGGSSMLIGISTLISKWFMGSILAVAMSVRVTFGRLITVTCSWAIPALYRVHNSLFLPFFVPALCCIVSVAIGLFLCWIDKTADEQEKSLQAANSNGEVDAEKIKNKNKKKKMSFKDFREFGALFWVVNLCCTLEFVAITTAMSLTGDLLTYDYQVPTGQVGLLQSIPFMMGAVLTLFAGVFQDKFGRRCEMNLLAACVMLAAHVMWLKFPIFPDDKDGYSSAYYITPLVFMGLSFSMFASFFWPSLPLIVPHRLLGTAFGASSVFFNSIILAFNYLAATIQAHTLAQKDGYYYSEVLFVSVCSVAAALALWLIFLDRKGGSPLGRAGSKEQREKLEALKASLSVQQ